jgi:hypothetical protein
VNRLIEFRAPDRLMSLNDRLHWSTRSTRTRQWRIAALMAAVDARNRDRWTLPLAPSVVAVGLPVATNTRRDPSNYIATVKPIVDGLVQAGLWPDDTLEWVTTVEPLLLRRAEKVRVLIVPRAELTASWSEIFDTVRGPE